MLYLPIRQPPLKRRCTLTLSGDILMNNEATGFQHSEALAHHAFEHLSGDLMKENVAHYQIKGSIWETGITGAGLFEVYG